MRKTRHILAVTLVATAICADRVAMASAEMRDPGRSIARQLATRLTVTLRRVVPAVRLHQARVEGMTARWPALPVVAAPAVVHTAESSPFQFRLPPPSV